MLVDPMKKHVSNEGTTRCKTKLICYLKILFILLLILLIVGAVIAVVIVMFVWSRNNSNHSTSSVTSYCSNIQCTYVITVVLSMYIVFHGTRMSLVESIPKDLTYNNVTQHLSTFDAWNMLMDLSNRTLHIASYYWTLRAFGNISGPTDTLVIVDNIVVCLLWIHCRVLKFLRRSNKLHPEELRSK